MKSDHKKNTEFRIIPNSENRCVWMEHGVVSYKICDRNFECQTCPLDQGLRGREENRDQPGAETAESGAAVSESQPAGKMHSSSFERLLKLKLDINNHVHPNHTVVRVVDKNCAVIGLDDLVAITLGSIDEVVLPQPGERLRREGNCGQIVQFENIFSIVSPLNGEIIETNKELADFPNELILDPLNKGWLIKIKPNDLEQDLKYCRSGDTLYTWYLKEFNWLEHFLSKGFEQRMSKIGLTLNDGGEISRNLRNYLPKEDYRRLIINLMGIPSK